MSAAESAIQEAVSLEQAAQEAARRLRADAEAKTRVAEDSAGAQLAVSRALHQYLHYFLCIDAIGFITRSS